MRRHLPAPQCGTVALGRGSFAPVHSERETR